jgi:SAM-dependent methyltransferase
VNGKHACNKAINPDRLLEEFSRWRAAQVGTETAMGSVLSTRAFAATYYEEHRAAGLDYLGHGEWQQNYAVWLADVFGWRGRPVLDVGCACGSIAKGFLDAGVDIAAIDVSEDMVGRGRATWQGLAPRLHVCDAVNLHLFGDGAFAGLHSAQVAEHWKPALVPHILQEAARVLQPGGLFFCCMDTAELYERQSRKAELEDPTHYCIRPLDWWREAFGAAGFRDRTAEFLPRLLAHPRSMLAGSTSGSRAKYDWDFLVAERA